MQEGAGSAPTALCVPVSRGAWGSPDLALQCQDQALIRQHSARLGQTVPSRSSHFTLLKFSATVTTLSRPCPLFHSQLPLIQSLCPFKLFFSPPIHFPDASVLFSCLAPLPEQLLC